MLVDTHGRQNRSILTANGTREQKIVVVGPRKVGKSALVVRFLTKRFINEYVENTDMSCKGVTELDGDTLVVNIQDTSDKGMRLASVEHHFRWADAIVLVYSITDRESFLKLKDTTTKILDKMICLEDKEQSRIPPLVVVGNKGDLDYVRKVSRQEGFELAEKLRCDFFEASAREGWSKLLTKCGLSSAGCSPSSDVDTIGLFAGVTACIGLLDQAQSGVSPDMSRCGTPLLSRGRAPSRSDLDVLKSSDSISLKRWASLNTLRQSRRSNSTVSELPGGMIPRVNVTSASSREHSLSSSPAYSEEESDEAKSGGFLSPPKARKSSLHSGIISKLSPRLGRRFSKSSKIDENRVTSIFRDDNNNKRKNKTTLNNISLGLPFSFFSHAKPGEVLSEQSSPSCSVSNSESGASTSTSTTGSTESLVNLGLENQDYKKMSLGSPIRSPLNEELHFEVKLREQEFPSSEPFLHLFRGRLSRGRMRSRSPSQKFMSGLKKIRSLAGEHTSQVNQANKTTVASTLLSIPTIKL